MKMLVLGAFLCASLTPLHAFARDCVPPSSPSSLEASSDSTYENVGVYEWDETQQAWVLLLATYDPRYETEVLSGSDSLISAESFYSGTGGGGGGGGGQYNELYENKGNSKKNNDDAVIMTEPCKLPPVTVTGSRPSFTSAGLVMFWRGPMLGGGGGGGGVAQRSQVRVKAPETGQRITCSTEPEVRIGAAQNALSAFVGFRHRGREFTVEHYATGTTETYEHLGAASFFWLKPKPGTCKNK